MQNSGLALLMVLLNVIVGIKGYSQSFSIMDQGIIRTFILHLPRTYVKSKSYPIVLNLHGLNSNGSQQQAYSRFDNFADSLGFIVAYPDAIDQSWKISGETDVTFLTHLIDTLKSKYSTNSCLFVTGMSMGGFMSYKLACALPKKITALAVVSGNMSIPLQNTCALSSGIPLMHFHGTDDNLVSWEGAPGIPPVEKTIKWWVDENQCNPVAKVTTVPDIQPSDNSTVEKYFYNNGGNGSTVTLYKILHGGHTWPGATIAIPFGFTNKDIDASAEIAAFFKTKCASTTAINTRNKFSNVEIFPNPTVNKLTIHSPDLHQSFYADIRIVDLNGKIMYSEKRATGLLHDLDVSKLPQGIYIVEITGKGYEPVIRKLTIAR